jgi:predicted Zn-ribbon and HTH transcriptional regulator
MMKFYPPDDAERTAADMIRTGDIWLCADVKCSQCGFEQALSNTISGRCARCLGEVR